MPTPETRRAVAERIAREHAHRLNGMQLMVLADAIEAALKARDERAARIAESHFESDAHKQHTDRCDKAIARAIRNEES